MKHSKSIKPHKTLYAPKFLLGGIAIGVVLATVGSIGAFNGWFGGGGGSVPSDTLTRGLVGYWAFEEASSSIAYDASNYANNGTTTNGPTWTKGKVGGAMEFDGTDDYLDVRDSDSLDITGAITLEAWVYDPPPVTDPTKKVKDEHTKALLREQGMDPDYVELFKDYGKRSEGKSPYARTYKDKQTGKYIMEVGGLPMVDADGTPIVPQWELQGNKYKEKNNLFKATVDGNNVELKVKNDQPDGRKTNDKLLFNAQLFLNDVEQTPSGPVLLDIDPTNDNYHNNVLEWDYGIAKRRLRLIEGRVLGSWVFASNPNGDARIVYNQTGDFKLNLGQYKFNGDEERVSAAQFNAAEYPFIVNDSATFFPDAHPETTSVDGYVGAVVDNQTWASIIADGGITHNDSVTTLRPVWITADTNPDTGWTDLYRSITVFDTSGLPDYAIISAATISLYGNAKADDLLATPDVNMYGATPTNNDDLINTDYAQIDSTALSSVITYANWSITGYNDFALNDLTKVNKTSQSKFGFRNANYDVAQIAPNRVSSANSRLSSWSSEKGAGFQSKLVVTYTVPVAGIVAKGRAAYQLEIDNSLRVVGFINGQGVTTTVSKAWHHIAFTYDGSDMKIYQDGILKDQAAATGAISTNNSNLKIGNLVPGKIDEVRVYNRALSAEEIRYHYNRGGPVAHWKFDEGNASTTYDTTDNDNDGTLSLGTSGNTSVASAWVAGKYGSALDFDGVDDSVKVLADSSIDSTGKTAYSIGAWIYPRSDGEGDIARILDKSSGYSLRVESEAAAGVKVEAFVDLSNTDANAITNNRISVNSWHYVVMAYNADGDKRLKIYLDGVLAGLSTDVAGSGTLSNDSTSNLFIGNNDTNGSRTFDGLIDDVRLYNYARTLEEIRLDYNAGFAARFGPTAASCSATPSNCMTRGLVGYWGMEEGNGTIAYDNSDYDNDGTLTSGPTWTKGKVGGALSFDNTDDYVSLSPSTLPTNAITVAVWVKINTHENHNRMVARGGWVGTTGAWLLFADATNWTWGIINPTPTQKNVYVSHNGDLGWHYLVGTYDGTIQRLYVDGTEVGTPLTHTVALENSSYFRIGDTVDPMSGLIDEVRIYNRALSTEEVRYHYNRGGPVAQWKFDEGEGRTAYDATDNNNDGTLVLVGSATSSAWVSGKYGSALSFDGVNDYVTFAANASLRPSTALSIEVWTKLNVAGDDIPWVKSASNYMLKLTGTSGKFTFPLYIDSGWRGHNSTQSLSLDQFYHIAATYDSATKQIIYYINGAQDSSSVLSGLASYTINTATESVQIGFNGVTNYFNGLIDDVRIYNYARTPEEIRLDYNAGFAAHFGPKSDCKRDPGSCMTQGLVGYWGMEEGNGTIAYDNSDYANNGTLTNGPTWTKGKIGGALNFNGNSDNSYVDIPDSQSLAITKQITIETWLNFNSLDALNTYYVFVSKEGGASRQGYNLAYIDTTNKIYLELFLDNVGKSVTTQKADFVTGTWYHILATYDPSGGAGNIKIYVNGVLDNQATGTGDIGVYSGISSISGRSSQINAYEFDGKIDEVRIYNRALSAEEVRYHYNRGAPVAQWKFDEGEGRTAYDSTDNNNDGTLVLVGSATSSAWVSGKYGSALSFDGVNDYVSVSDSVSLSPTTAITISSWVYTSQANFGSWTIVGKNAAYQNQLVANNKIENSIYTGGAWTQMITTNSVLTPGQWNHVVITYDGSYQKIYANGQFIEQWSLTGAINDSSDSLYIGSWTGGSEFFNGLIDDVRIYNYARTPEQILQDYNSGFSARFR